MKTIRHTAPSLRALFAVLLMASWLVATNRCAFGGMPSVVGTVEKTAVCPGCEPAPGSAPVPASGGQKECCQPLQSTPADSAKVLASYNATLFTLLDFALLTPAAPRAVEASATPATGPPRCLSFAELILHRSLRSHAPPFAV